MRLLFPAPAIKFREIYVDTKRVVLLEIPKAVRTPLRFRETEYIRVGSCKRKLKDLSEQQRRLWTSFERTPFEEIICAEHITGDEIIHFLDYPSYFDLLAIPLPPTRAHILDALSNDGLIVKCEGGLWSITNIGAILIAKKLSDCTRISRKSVRVIQYKGIDRLNTIKEQGRGKGYANGFEGLITYINGIIPSNEIMGQALRRDVPTYPELAVRELVANALIHQDFCVGGSGPLVEIFSNRMEICNPGAPLVPTERLIDTPPRSRNEQLAALMRRFGVCEERGSGIDKVVFHVEYYQLPPPMFEVAGQNTRVILFGPRPLSRMDKADRVRACYQHACLKYVNREHMTNSTLRQRFGIEVKNIAQASRIIREAVASGEIVPHDETAAPKQMKYVPWWAADGGT